MKKYIPKYSYKEFFEKKNDTILIIPVWNEGERIQKELKRLYSVSAYTFLDIILLDGGTTDNSINDDFLKEVHVRGVCSTTAKGQGSSYRIGFNKAIEDDYKYCLTVDGNNKDSVEQVEEFIKLLKNGYDFVQGSRFMKGGYHENTPKAREIAIKYFSNPLLSVVSGFKYTETMSAFRGFNVDILKDERLNIFRDIFKTWELQWYMATRIPKLGYKVIEIPQSRIYPATGPVVTKINWMGNFRIIIQLLKVSIGYYNPKK